MNISRSMDFWISMDNCGRYRLPSEDVERDEDRSKLIWHWHSLNQIASWASADATENRARDQLRESQRNSMIRFWSFRFINEIRSHPAAVRRDETHTWLDHYSVLRPRAIRCVMRGGETCLTGKWSRPDDHHRFSIIISRVWKSVFCSLGLFFGEELQWKRIKLADAGKTGQIISRITN